MLLSPNFSHTSLTSIISGLKRFSNICYIPPSNVTTRSHIYECKCHNTVFGKTALNLCETPDISPQDKALLFAAYIQIVQNAQLLIKNRSSISAGEHPRIGAEDDSLRPEDVERFLKYLLQLESIRKIVIGDIAEPSIPGIIIAIISIIVMPVLGYRKLKLGNKLGLKSLVADSKETFVCAFLSIALLVGLTTRYFFDFWLADPIVGLIIVMYLFSEGFELVRGDEE